MPYHLVTILTVLSQCITLTLPNKFNIDSKEWIRLHARAAHIDERYLACNAERTLMVLERYAFGRPRAKDLGLTLPCRWIRYKPEATGVTTMSCTMTYQRTHIHIFSSRIMLAAAQLRIYMNRLLEIFGEWRPEKGLNPCLKVHTTTASHWDSAVSWRGRCPSAER